MSVRNCPMANKNIPFYNPCISDPPEAFYR